jgi:glycosyltransferase involved in cell wall biosynthesis
MMDIQHAAPKEIMVSVLMITYNHEKYIEEAIRGILMQQVDFSAELLICNDASTDNTNKLIKSCILNNSSQLSIRYNHHNQNIGMMANFIFGLENCNGKYVALCEGDDYWTDPLKLKRQVNFLEANPDYSICFHRVYESSNEEDLKLSTLNNSIEEETYTIEDLAVDNIIHTPCVIFRNNMIKKLPNWYVDSPVGDYPLHMLNAKFGKIKYFPETMAVYRRHDNGIWSGKGQLHQSTGWVWMLTKLVVEFKGTEVEKILLEQKVRNELYISNFNQHQNATLKKSIRQGVFYKLLRKFKKSFFK